MTPAIAGWLRSDLRRFDFVVAVLTVALSTLLIASVAGDWQTGWPEIPAGVAAFILVLLRRRWPLLLLAVALVSATAFIAVWERPTTLVFAGLVLLATACLHLDRWPAIGLGVVVGVIVYLMALVGFLEEGAELGDSDAVIGLVWSALAVGVADAVRSWRRFQNAAVIQRESEARASQAQVRQQVSEERLSIARELHDLLAHNLSVMNVQTGAALHLLRSDPDQAEASLTTAREAGRTVLDELSGLLSVLRHDGDDAPHASLPTFDELPQLVDTMRASGLELVWTKTGTTLPLSATTSLAAYRIVQEALTNAVRHGDGSAHLTTEWGPDGISLRVTNPVGRTIAREQSATPRHGLVGMRERSSGNGGRFSTSTDNGQFVVDAWLPTALTSEERP